MKKNNLNFEVFILICSGNFFCNPIEIDQNQPKKITMDKIMIIGRNFIKLIISCGKEFRPGVMFEKMVDIIII